MDALWLDLTYAVRAWRRQPGTTLAAVLALALGIGATSTIFSFVSAVLLRPLPYTDPGRLVMVWQDRSAKGGPAREVFSPGLFIDWRTRASALQGLAAFRNWGPNLTGRDTTGNDEPERLSGAAVSGAYFSTLGVPPAHGRTFTNDDARATQRRTEMAVRAALGANRARLIRQLLVESALLALAGMICGLGLAWFGVQLLVSAAPPSAPRLSDVHLDGSVLLFTVAISAVSAILSGLAPAATASRLALIAGLREGARETRGFSRSRSLLVVAEVAAAMTLVIGAGLFVRSLIGLQHVDLGFVPDRLLTASIAPPRGTYRSEEAVRGLFDQMVERASTLPGVQSAAITSVLPLSGAQIMFNFRIEGRPPANTPNDQPVASFRSVSQNFFTTMGMRIVEGRGFQPDDRASSTVVAVVNQALVKRYWNGVSPIGAHIGVNGNDATIVGVVADVHHTSPAATPEGEMYLPYAQLSARQGWIVVRTTGDPAALGGTLRASMREIAPNLPLARVRSMTSLVADSVAQSRFLATLLTAFSSVAAVLALMGVYGLLAFSVSQRVREIGVRMALGATRASVIRLVLRQSLGVVIGGVAIGAIAGVLNRPRALSRHVHERPGQHRRASRRDRYQHGLAHGPEGRPHEDDSARQRQHRHAPRRPHRSHGPRPTRRAVSGICRPTSVADHHNHRGVCAADDMGIGATHRPSDCGAA